jgi:chromosome partitioning protein
MTESPTPTASPDGRDTRSSTESSVPTASPDRSDTTSSQSPVPTASPEASLKPEERPERTEGGGAPPIGAGVPEPRPSEPLVVSEVRAEPIWRVPAPQDRRARVIALANQKGGVGKTTTAINLGAGLGELGARLLLVDFDPQGGCGIGLGVEPASLATTVYDVLLDRTRDVSEAIVPTNVANLDLLPSNIDLAGAELMLVHEIAREQSLQRVLDPLRVEYDFILIDCPPSLGLLTVNALTAADGVIVPVECEYYALRGVALLMDSIDRIRERLNPRLQVDGILPTMFDGRTLHGREVLERVQDAFGDRVFSTAIRKTVRFAEAPVAGEPILTYSPASPGAVAYRRLAQEVIARVTSGQLAGSR